MPAIAPLLVFLHVAANVVWIGSIVSVAVILGSPAGDPNTRGTLAVEVYRKLATPAFVLSFVAGVSRLGLDTRYYFVATKFMHGKLFLALVVIGLHHAIGGRAKKLAAGTATNAGGVRALGIALVLASMGAVFFVVLKPF
ncbi:MAG TPA: CopD family protein [Polyangiaceae bacterium]